MIERPGFEQAQFDSIAGGGAILFPENGTVPHEVEVRVDSLVNIALRDATERTNKTPEAILRVTNAIERRFRPYVWENEFIALQISSPEYEASIRKTNDYLQGRVAAVDCDDGRITNDQLGEPRVMSVSRRLQGLPEIRRSTKNRNLMILSDPAIQASIKNYIEREKRKGNMDPFITEFPGPHIMSVHPLEGCGKAMGEIRYRGGSVEVGMWDGGINDYFNKLGDDGFQAFNNLIDILGGKGETFDTTHDAYSQGLIFGLKDARHKFDRNKKLRDNLVDLHHQGEILMTELLDAPFYQRIRNMAGDFGFHNYIDLNDINHFGRNNILISEIAREITRQEEEKGFAWIPKRLIDGKDERAVRALGYVSMRNVVRRVLGNIKLGDHELIEHPEQIIRVGPIGADNNIQVIPFIHHTTGSLHTADIKDIETLNGLLEGILRQQHNVNFQEEGRIIVTTGEFDRSRYIDDEKADEAREEINSEVGDNAAKIRDRYEKAVENGEIIVIGGLHEPRTRSLTHIVK